MFEYFINYFLLLLNYLEHGRKWLYEATAQWASEREYITEQVYYLESKFKNFHPFTIIIGFVIFSYLIKKLIKKVVQFWRSINSFEKIKINVIKLALYFGAARAKLQKTRKEIKEKMLENVKDSQFKKMEFRSNGQDMRAILNKLSAMNNADKETIGGPNTKITGSIYINDSDIETLVGEAIRMYGYSNLLHPDLFCSARFIETQLIKIGVELFNGDKEKCCGITTTGGSESILYAMLAYRNRGYKMGIKKPEIIIPVTAHAAFDKASEAFNIKMVKIPLNSKYQVDIRKVSRAINSNTVAIVGSCPNFPHGNYDDIEALSALAVKNKVPLHVDACLGGLLIAFYGSANLNIPKFDFRLPGVTSISADYHKYGLCPKGISLLLYKDRNYRKHQYFIYPRFMGGLYPSPGFEGSRTPAFVVAAYAVMMYLGKNRYINQAKAIHEAVKKIKKFVKDKCEGLEVIGDPEICSVAVTGPKATLVYDQMSSKGWHLNLINSPTGFSFVVTSANIENVNNGSYFKDLENSVNFVNENKGIKVSEQTRLYGLTLDLPEPIVKENLDVICDCMLDG